MSLMSGFAVSVLFPLTLSRSFSRRSGSHPAIGLRPSGPTRYGVRGVWVPIGNCLGGGCGMAGKPAAAGELKALPVDRPTVGTLAAGAWGANQTDPAGRAPPACCAPLPPCSAPAHAAADVTPSHIALSGDTWPVATVEGLPVAAPGTPKGSWNCCWNCFTNGSTVSWMSFGR